MCDAELVLAQPGRDVRVRAGIDVGVHAQRHRRTSSERTGDVGQALQLAAGLHVEAAHARPQRGLDFSRALADPRKDDPACVTTCGKHPLQLAFRHDVESGAGAREQFDHGQIGVRLERVTDERLATGRRGREFRKRAGDRGSRIHVGGSTEAFRDCLQRYTFGEQRAVAIVEPVDHRMRLTLRARCILGSAVGALRSRFDRLGQVERTTLPAAREGDQCR
jgi:hypothetical protein